MAPVRLLVLLSLLGSPLVVSAQDMPLSSILIEGENWKEAPKLADALPPAPKDGFTEPRKGEFAVKNGKLTYKGAEVKTPVKSPAGLTLWTDNGTLVVADAVERRMWAFRVGKDGELSAGEGYYTLQAKPKMKRDAFPHKTPATEFEPSETTALCCDPRSRLYAATKLGIQIFDPTARLCGVIAPPAPGPIAAMGFGGLEGDELLVRIGDKVYARKMQVKPPMKK